MGEKNEVVKFENEEIVLEIVFGKMFRFDHTIRIVFRIGRPSYNRFPKIGYLINASIFLCH